MCSYHSIFSNELQETKGKRTYADVTVRHGLRGTGKPWSSLARVAGLDTEAPRGDGAAPARSRAGIRTRVPRVPKRSLLGTRSQKLLLGALTSEPLYPLASSCCSSPRC